VIEKVVRRLESEGFRVSRREFVEGLSGIRHFFDVVVEDTKSGRRAAITVVERLGFEHVMAMLAARIDARIPHLVFAGSVDEGVDEILKGSGVSVVNLGSALLAVTSPEGEEELVNAIVRAVREAVGRG